MLLREPLGGVVNGLRHCARLLITAQPWRETEPDGWTAAVLRMYRELIALIHTPDVLHWLRMKELADNKAEE